jgi:phosphatidylinositol-3-phosphatase
MCTVVAGQITSARLVDRPARRVPAWRAVAGWVGEHGRPSLKFNFTLLTGIALLLLAATQSGVHGLNTRTAAAVVPSYDHIFFVIDENHSRSQVIGPAPYLTSLANANAQSSTYYAVTHPSVNNYLALFSGQTYAGITDNCIVGTGTCNTSAPNLADEIVASGRTAKGYMESLPSPCYGPHDAGSYTERHNPFPYFDQIRNDATRCSSIVPYTQLASDLGSAATTPNFAWITPNLKNDMHNGSVAQGDIWAQSNFPAIFNSPAWKTQRSLLMFTLDEDDGSAGNNVAFFAVSSDGSTKTNYTSTVNANAYDALRTIEASWGLGTMTANDAVASPMSDLFTGGTSTPGAITGTVTSASGGGAIAGAMVTDNGGASTTTDSSGVYTLAGLAPGSQTLTASAPGFISAQQTATVTAAQVTQGVNWSLTPDPPPPPPRLVQSSGVTESSASTSLTATFSTPASLGNLLVLSASVYAGATNQLSSVVDPAGSAWTKIGAFAVAGHNSDGEMWYAISAGPVSSVTVRTTNPAVVALAIQEFSGVATTAPLDAFAGAANSGTSAASGAVTPATNGDLVVGFIAGHTSSQSISVTSPGNALQGQLTSGPAAGLTVASVVTGYQVVTSTNPLSFTGNFASSMYWAAGVVIFEAATVTRPPPTTGAVTGRVTSTSGGLVIAGARVSDAAGNSIYSDGSGFYTLTGLTPGSDTITATAAGFNPQTLTAPVNAGQTTQQVNFSLPAQPPGGVTGTVYNGATGGVIAGATVLDSGGASAVTDSSGVYTLSGLTPGSHALTAAAAGFNAGSHSAMVNSGQATPNVNFSLTPTPGAATGAVTNAADGTAIASATVRDSGGASATTDSSGAYTLTGLTPGSHTLTASATAFTSQAVTVSITAGQTTQSVNFRLTSAPPGAVSGTVKNASTGATMRGASVSASGGGSTTTDVAGAYTLTGLSPGSHTVTAFASGFAGQTQTASVTASQTTSGVNFSLAPTASGAPQLVQAAGASETSAATSLTDTFSTSTSAAHLLVLSASVYAGATNRVTSVTDSGGNTWTKIGAFTVPGHNSDGEMWYSANAKPVTAVTVQTTKPTMVSVEVQEFSGVSTTSPLDVSAGNANIGTTPTSGAVTPALVGDLVVGFVAGHGSTQAMSVSAPGYSSQSQQTSAPATGLSVASVVTGYQVLTSTSASTFTASFSSSMYWAAAIACFKAGP